MPELFFYIINIIFDFLNKAKILLLSFFLILLVSNNVFATHIMGGDLTYECIGANQYKLYLTVYRDCEGVTLDTDQDLNYYSNSCGQSERSVPFSFLGKENITPICSPDVITTCSSSSNDAFPGSEKYSFSAIVTLPNSCTDWVFYWEECCRNKAITNLVNPDDQGFTITATLNDVAAPCNNSPVFTTRPVSFICANTPFNFNHGAVDSDGDELRFSMVNPKSDDGLDIDFITPYNKNLPIAGSFSVNNNNGQLKMEGDSAQVFVSTMIVEEYRNNIKIGSIIRELQTIVLENTLCGNVYIVGIRNVEGGTQTDNTSILVCPKIDLSFDVLFLSSGANNIRLNSNVNQAIPGATVTTSTQDTLSFTVKWTPDISDAGQHSAVFKITYCTLEDFEITQAFAVDIEVGSDRTDAGPDRKLCSVSQPIKIEATGGNHFSWQPTEGIVNALPDSSTIWVLPNLSNGQNLCYTVTSDLDPSICFPTDQVCITQDGNSTIVFNQRDTAICGGYIIINDQVVTESGSFFDTIPRPDDCDSIVETKVVFVPSDVVSVDTFICGNAFIIMPGIGAIYNTGVYVANLKDRYGCDSLVEITVSRRDVKYSYQSATICEGDSFLLPSNIYAHDYGRYYDTLDAYNLCDSIIRTTLNISYPDRVAIVDSFCSGGSYVLHNDSIVNTGGVYIDSFINRFGCDSIITTTLTIKTFIHVSTIRDSFCLLFDYTLFNGVIVDQPGTYTDTVTAFNGCDSIVITILNYKKNPNVQLATFNNVCLKEGDILLSGGTPIGGSYLWNNQVSPNFNTLISGIGIDTISYFYVAPNSCVDTVSQTITVVDYSRKDTTVYICEDEFYQLSSGRIINQADIYSDTINARGVCGEIILIDLIVDEHLSYSNIEYFCEGGYFVLPDGDTARNTGFFVDSFLTIHACDSVIFTDLRIKSSPQCLEDCFVIMPNAFSPNNDLRNDVFRALTSCEEDFQFFEMRVYNRLSQHIFTSNDYEIGWDGTFNGSDVTMDTYVYIVTFIRERIGEIEYLKGSVSLIR